MSRHIIQKFSDYHKNWSTLFGGIVSNKKNEYKEFIIKFTIELNNTKEAKEVLIKYAKGLPVSDQEIVFFKKQVVEVAKGIGLGIPVVLLPGGIILLAFIVWLSNKFSIDILPSYLKQKKED